MKKLITAAAVMGVAVAMSVGAFEVSAQEKAGKVPWKRMPGKAMEIGAGGGQVYHLGMDKGRGGYMVYRWTGKNWQNMQGSGIALDVGPKGLPWVVNNQNDIYRHNGTKWLKVPGKARDIGVGANGQVWVIGTKKMPGGYSIHRLRNNGWQTIKGGAVRIDVGPKGFAWVVNDKGAIYRFDGKKWNNVKGRATAISVNGKLPMARVWALGWGKAKHGRFIYSLNGGKWVRFGGELQNITVDSAGMPIGHNNTGAIYAHANSRVWKPAPLPGQDPAVWKQRLANTKKLIGLNRKKAAELKGQLKSIQDQLKTVDADHAKLQAQLKKVETEMVKLK